MDTKLLRNLTESYYEMYENQVEENEVIEEQQIGVPLKDASDRAAKKQLEKMIPKGEKVHMPKSSLQNAGFEPEGDEISEAEVLAMRGGVPGSVKVRPALSIPGTSIGVGPNKPVPGTFTTTTPAQREKIAKGDTTIDRGTYMQPRAGAGPTASERSRYNAELSRQGKHTAPRMREDVDVYDEILELLLDEGFSEKDAIAIMATMTESVLNEMSDFAAGGGNAKMKKTGMSRSEVEALGKKNLAATPKSSGDAVPSPKSKTTSASYKGKSAMQGKIQKLKDMEELEALQQRRNQRWAKNELQPGVGGTRSLADVEADTMRAQGKDFGVDPKETEKSINIIMQRRRKAAGM